MRGTLLWLVAALAFASLTLTADGALKVLSAPNLLRVGTAENIFVECQDCTGGNIDVTVKVMNHPTKTTELAKTSVTLTSAKDFQALAQITISADDFNGDPTVKQYVYLQAQFPDRLLEKVVLVSFQAGYIFIQTDKTLYTPESTVHFRMFGVTPRMEPVERNEKTDASISIEIVTPDGIILPLDPVFLKSGLYSGDYKLRDIASFGVWKVVAKFQSNPQQSFAAEFEVKEYVLPGFEVKLLPVSPFYYVDSPELTINIRAKYLFGEEVDGTAYVVFGVVENNQKRGLQGSLQRVAIKEGKGDVTLKREHITQTFPNIHELVGNNIYVAVSVLMKSGSEMVEAELKNIQIVTSPYTISFKKTPKYFKPGMSFDVTVNVLNPDDTPAQGVTVVVEPGHVTGVSSPDGLVRLPINTMGGADRLVITAKTSDPLISADRQAAATMTALPHITQNNNYIHIAVNKAELELEENLKIHISLNKHDKSQKDITYLIIWKWSKKKLPELHPGGLCHTNDDMDLCLFGFLCLLTFLPPPGQLSTFSRNLGRMGKQTTQNIGNSFAQILSRGQLVKYGRFKRRGQVLISLTLPITKEMMPSFRFIAYYHTNDNEVVSDSVWVDVKDTCMGSLKLEASRPAPSYDPRRLFRLKVTGEPNALVGLVAVDSGVYNMKNALRITQKRIWDIVEEFDTGCTAGGGKDSMGVFYDAGLLFESSASRTPHRPDLKCPSLSRRKRASSEMDASIKLDNKDDPYMDSSEIDYRSMYPESWMWLEVKLPPCSQHTPDCATTSVVKNFPLKDSITTWQFTAISLSSAYGICVADPFEVKVQKKFFIDLKLPYSAVRGEQLEIKAIVHNHSPNNITVRVVLFEEEHVCSAAFKHGKYQLEVKVRSQTTKSVPFIIIPMKEGNHPIKVTAAVKNSSLNDGIRKTLQVVPQGILIKLPQTITLDPVIRGDGFRQDEVINSGIPVKDIFPDTPTSTIISVTGKEPVALAQDYISAESMGSLIIEPAEPAGPAVPNIVQMMLPVVATIYLDETNQWDAVGFEKRGEALRYIYTGYLRQLAHRKSDGSFAVFHSQPSNNWLTAHVVKVFAMASKLVRVSNIVICQAVNYLILKSQRPDGSFADAGPLFDSHMMSDLRGTDSDASMTAFFLIAMQESRTLCDATVNSLPVSIDKAAAYLESRLSSLINPYTVAMASYALASENRLNQRILYNFASPELNHWPVPKGRVYTLEATAYALLALVKAKAYPEATAIVRWLSREPKVGGGYGSMQATSMVYQAVAEYWDEAKEPEYNLNVDILVPGRTIPDKFHFYRDNHYRTFMSKFNGINKDVNVTASGIGEAKLTMMSIFYTLPREGERNDCQKFNLSVQLHPVKIDDDEKIYKLKIEVLYKDSKRDATLSVLDIGLLTGFTVNTKDLDLLSEGPERTISRYDMNSPLSEKGSLIIFLDKVSHTQPEVITFRIHQQLKVGLLQPAAVSVYEYYDQTPCVNVYHLERGSGEKLPRLCRQDECPCVEVICGIQRINNLSNDERIAQVCESISTNHTDFVHKVTVENVTHSLSIDSYKVRIVEVIKEGSYHVHAQGDLQTMLSLSLCRATLDLEIGKNYLIMGSPKEVHKGDQPHHYLLGKGTWIQYWPTGAECHTEEH